MAIKKLSIIIPAYNELDTIRELLAKVENVKIPGIKKEIIIVDDCSTDGTREILQKLKGHKVFFHKKNGGKGTALRTGLRHCTGDVIIIQDADLEYDPEDYNKLIQPILAGETEVVYGSRFKGRGVLDRTNWSNPLHYIGNTGLSMITSIFYGGWVSDMETCYKMFTRKVLESMTLKAKRFDFEPEITSKILKAGFKIREIEIEYHPRKVHEGKKITWRDGMQAFWYLMKYRFTD